MKAVLNDQVKRRGSFCSFMPSVLMKASGEYFDRSEFPPFMLKVYRGRGDKKDHIPAVTHVDQTGRLQTVDKRTNPKYWQLIKTLERLIGISIALNTSFNENELIVNTPKDVIECFLRTKMDALIIDKK